MFIVYMFMCLFFVNLYYTCIIYKTCILYLYSTYTSVLNLYIKLNIQVYLYTIIFVHTILVYIIKLEFCLFDSLIDCFIVCHGPYLVKFWLW